jgi:hypothetical protein
MKLILLFISSLLLADFTLTYRIDNKIIQTSYYKDNNHTLFKFKTNDKIVQELIIIDNKKYLRFTENGKSKVYEIPYKKNDSKKLSNLAHKYKIIQTQENGGYDFKTEKWIIAKADKNETIIVSKDKKIYPKVKKMVYALKRLLPSNQEPAATIFDMGSGYALIKSKDIELLSHNENSIKISTFNIQIQDKLKSISQNIDRCSLHVCCGSSEQIKPAIELNNYINKNSNNWKLINIASCSNSLENAILTNGNNYVIIDLNKNKKEMILNLQKNGIKTESVDIKKESGYTIKSTYISAINTAIKDIVLPTKTISIYTKGKIDLDAFIKKVIFLQTPQTL